mmetsp:Transcript_6750/g.16470  ORF Transcript_6750/g.16470 Transcript_6750/m.16470 type:complete len:263 (+) Transcript_6750:946-1734(+)
MRLLRGDCAGRHAALRRRESRAGDRVYRRVAPRRRRAADRGLPLRGCGRGAQHRRRLQLHHPRHRRRPEGAAAVDAAHRPPGRDGPHQRGRRALLERGPVRVPRADPLRLAHRRRLDACGGHLGEHRGLPAAQPAARRAGTPHAPRPRLIAPPHLVRQRLHVAAPRDGRGAKHGRERDHAAAAAYAGAGDCGGAAAAPRASRAPGRRSLRRQGVDPRRGWRLPDHRPLAAHGRLALQYEAIGPRALRRAHARRRVHGAGRLR